MTVLQTVLCRLCLVSLYRDFHCSIDFKEKRRRDAQLTLRITFQKLGNLYRQNLKTNTRSLNNLTITYTEIYT